MNIVSAVLLAAGVAVLVTVILVILGMFFATIYGLVYTPIDERRHPGRHRAKMPKRPVQKDASGQEPTVDELKSEIERYQHLLGEIAEIVQAAHE